MSTKRPRKERRNRTTRLGVRISERLSRFFITVGGVGTIAAVILIFVFLVAVALPLFTGAEVAEAKLVPAERGSAVDPVSLIADEYGVLTAVLFEDGRVVVRSLETGEVLEEQRPFEELGVPTAWSPSAAGESLAFGFEDGSIRTGLFGFATSFPEDERIPADLRELGLGENAEHEGGILQRTPEGKFRLQRFEMKLADPVRLSQPAPIRRLAHIDMGESVALCAWTTDDRLVLARTAQRTNLLTGEVTLRLTETQLAYEVDAERGPPLRIVLTGIGDGVLLLWEDGQLERIDARKPNEAVVAEILDVVREEGSLTSVTFLIGNSTLITGTSSGEIVAWFGTKPEDADTVDGTVLVRGHELLRDGPAVTSLAAAPRSRMLAAGFADGSIRLFHVTTDQTLATIDAAELGQAHAVRLMPKEDGILAFGEHGIGRWKVDPRHPEASVAAFFGKVWYEGYPEPEHVWQSESATDDFEPKLGFMPLVYGTLKATFYSMIFGTPLALLAAIYTSEFLGRRLRVPVKSTIEMMASLPSVVLGFLAGIVIAPFAQTIIPATLAIFATLPLTLLLGAYLWQLLPQGLAIRWSGMPRLFCMAVALPLGVVAALLVGPWIETVFFAGDIELWLDGQIGNGVGGWMLLILPASGVLVALFGGRWFNAWMRSRAAGWTRAQCAIADISKFGGATAATVLVALGISWALELAGLDPRGSFVDTYVQRNALVVGFVMGFAIIPIIYTLAEDALTSVPEHLRQASLGAGATPWQTAMRVIVPTAMSGLFSAVMIGLGRAVGETMIVLMATGNTPVMEANIFNGFRTLSANIAVELPEAVQHSTHFRALFLAALVLFAMTFVLNTLAESVRQRFRKRAYQL